MNTTYMRVTSTKNAVNPFIEFRKRNKLSQDRLALLANVSRGLVIRNEQAMYQNPSDTLMAYIVEKSLPVGAFQRSDPDLKRAEFKEEFIEAYKVFQLSQRRANYGFLKPDFDITHYLTSYLDTHPMKYWREVSPKQPNLSSVTRAFCVHQGILYRWEHETTLVNSVPSQLQSALLDAGYSLLTLEQLNLAFREHKRSERNKALGRNKDLNRVA